ncbi:hypothetical protein HDU76_011848, partial [Blyttiomyces sp. JEL0837]
MDLVDKLDHPLDEVRKRALDSLVFKLSNGFLDIENLAYDRKLIDNSVNFARSCLPNQRNDLEGATSILKLIEMLSDHPYAKRCLQSNNCHALVNDLCIFTETPETRQLADTIAWRLALGGGDIHTNIQPKYSSQYSTTSIESKKPIVGLNLKPLQLRNIEENQNSQGDSYTPDFSRFPLVPNAIPTYEYIHLSPVDEEVISDFCLLAQNPVVEDTAERRLFDILSLDFGSQIFLQRPQLFRTVLGGLDIQMPARFNQTLLYLNDLILEWIKEFRRICSTPVALASLTPINNTPNVSIIMPPHEPSSSAPSETPISFLYASHEVYLKLVPCLKFRERRPEVVKLIYKLLPSLLLHFDTIREKLATSSAHGTNINDIILDYTLPPIMVICSAERSSRESATISFEIDRLVEFSCDIVSHFSTMEDLQMNTVKTIVSGILDLPSRTSFVSTLARHILTKPSINSAVLLSRLLTHRNKVVRLGAVSELEYASRKGILDHNILVDFLSFILVERAFCDPDQEIKDAFQNCIKSILAHYSEVKSKDQLDSFIGLLIWLQVFSDDDDLELFTLAMSTATKAAVCIPASLWIRGLFHRDLRVRKNAVDHLVAAYPQLNRVTDHGISLESALLFTQPLTLDQARDSEMFSGQKDRRARDLSLAALIIRSFDKQADWPSFESALSQALRICAVAIENSEEQILATFANEDYYKILLRSEFLFHTNERVRFEYARFFNVGVFSNVLILRNLTDLAGTESKHTALLLPEKVVEKYHSYVAINTLPPTLLSDSASFGEEHADMLKTFMREYRQVVAQVYGEVDNPFYVHNMRLIEGLAKASSHSEFEDLLHNLSNACLSTKDFAFLGRFDLKSVFSRFLMHSPGSFEDECLLKSVMRFLTDLQLSTAISTPGLLQLIQESILTEMMPLLRTAVLPNENVSDFKSTQSDLYSEVAGFVKTYLQKLCEDDLARLLASDSFIGDLCEYASHIFSSQVFAARDHIMRINCLECILVIANFKDLVLIVPGHLIASIVRLLVTILGYSQQNYVDSTNGNAFTYKDRCVYRLVALCLRNLCRCVIVLNPTYKPWLWGEQWLFDNDIDWLLILMNDDERMIQKYGLGILGNLILIKESYHYLCTKMPQFLDMAFSYVLDFDRSDILRTEALLIINNFVITFCHDNKLSPVNLIPSNEDSLTDIDTTEENTSDTQNEKVLELLKIFDHCGFFDRIRETLDGERVSVSYRCAMAELLLNLTILAPDFVFKILCQTQAWNVFLEYMSGQHDWATTQDTHYTRQALEMVLALLSDILWDWNRLLPGDIKKYFETTREALPFLKLLLGCVEGRAGKSIQKVGCLVTARLLSLHYGEVANLGLDNLMQQLRGGNEVMEIAFTGALFSMMRENDNVDDPVFMESLRLSLQCLLGRSTISKKYAISEGIPGFLIEYSTKCLGPNRIVDPNNSNDLFFALSVLRHLFAGSVEAKCSAQKKGLFVILSDVLSSPNLPEGFLHECLCCLRNAIANSSTIRYVVDSHSRSSRQKTILESVLKIFKAGTHPEDVFNAAIEVLKLLALNSDTRSGILNDWITIAENCGRSKEFAKVDCLLGLLRNITYSSDGQHQTLKTNGALTVLADLLNCKSVSVKTSTLLILCNLAVSKENRSYFIADGKDSAADAQFKTKVAMKRVKLSEYLIDIQRRLDD